MLNVRSYSSWRLSQLSLLVPNLSVLKYFDFTLPRHKSSKIEGSGPLIMSHSIQFHCVVLTSPLYLKGKPFTQDVIWKGYMFQVIVFCRCLIFFWKKIQNFAKNQFKSYNSTANFSIFKIRIFRINRCSQSHLGWHLRKLKAQSSKVSFATFQWKNDGIRRIHISRFVTLGIEPEPRSS